MRARRLAPSCIDVYELDGACNKWLLPIAGAAFADEAGRLATMTRNLRVAAIDGVDTLCAVVTGRWCDTVVKRMKAALMRNRGTTVLETEVHDLVELLGEGIVKRFFEREWVLAHNQAQMRRNRASPPGEVIANPYRTGTVRDYARRSL